MSRFPRILITGQPESVKHLPEVLLYLAQMNRGLSATEIATHLGIKRECCHSRLLKHMHKGRIRRRMEIVHFKVNANYGVRAIRKWSIADKSLRAALLYELERAKQK